MKKKQPVEKPVYLFAGFLDSGKTRFINSILADGFAKEERTVLLCCEEGEIEYDPKVLKNVTVIPVEDFEDIDRDFFDDLEDKYNPEQVLIEWNGMWPMQKLIEEDLPDNWLLYQVMTIVESSTFENYVRNMGQIMMEKVINADMLVFNRCTPGLAETLRSRNLRMVNRRCEMFIEYTDGTVEPYADPDECPFDLSADEITIADNDYGIWFVDIMDHPDRWAGKTVRIKLVMCHSRQFPGVCCPGRFAMVCCEEDVQFLGLIAEGANLTAWNNHDWVNITARVTLEEREAYQGAGPILNVLSVTPADPAVPDVVQF